MAQLRSFAAADAAGTLIHQEAALEHALKRFPLCALLHHYRGRIQDDTGRAGLALASFGQAARLRPDFAEFRLTFAQSCLAHGLFDLGWSEFEWRNQLSRAPSRAPRAPAWDGTPAPGKRLLVHAEQGRGDVVQFSRFLRALPDDMDVVFEVYDDLAALFADLPVRIAPIGSGGTYDAECSLLSLPHLLGLSRSAISGAPHLRPAPETQASWNDRLSGLPGRRVGVVWRGNPQFALDRRRSITAEAMACLAETPGLSFVNLQKDARTEELAAWRAATPIFDPMDEIGSFADTAGLISVLDLVISVDTAVAHLGGALGVPTWLLNRTPGHWTWQTQGSSSIWYDSVRQFRQSEPGAWEAVIDAVDQALKSFATQA